MEATILNNRILDIVRKLNGGNIIKNQPDIETQINLFEEGLWIFRDFDGKNYLFAEYGPGKNSLNKIENLIYKNENLRNDLNPSDSYLILLQTVDAIDGSLYSSIIKVEENEFFFKKYIFYYTEQEYSSFMNWSKNLPEQEDHLQMLINKLSISTESSEENYFKFFVRLLIKVPVLNPIFPKAEMVDFEKLVEEKLGSVKKEKDELYKLNTEITEILTAHDNNIEEIVDSIYTKFLVKQ